HLFALPSSLFSPATAFFSTPSHTPIFLRSTTMNDLFIDRHPSCVHSTIHHNIISTSNLSSAVGSSSCSCEECARYKLPPHSEQTPAISDQLLQQQQQRTMSSTAEQDGDRTGTSATSPPLTYLIRRSSVVNTTASPKMQPAGFGLGGSSSGSQRAKMQHQRRASVDFHNQERSFQQHSTACDCRGSGVGCECSYTCDC
ncbi:hypothetical protein BC939DRAFT_16229, partial [Gamsiella multidivaricata]|uniref:uncharacterized protein n=1 Tax=Gamsiella multidivaricata TaxID=101098 RepID=UPI00221EA81A